MFQEYCPKCKKIVNNKDELELIEKDFEGDWEYHHIICNTLTTSILKEEN